MKRRALRLLVCGLGATAFVASSASSASAAIAALDTWNVAASSVWVDSNGGVVTVTGTTVQKRTAAGSVVWTANLTSGFNFSHHLVFDSANNMYLDGFDDIRTDPASVTVVKVSSAGAVNWTMRYAVGAVNASEHMAEGPMIIAPNGSLYVLGREGQMSSGPYGCKLYRINTSTGAALNNGGNGLTLPPTTDATGAGMPDSSLAADTSSNIYYGSPAGLAKINANADTVLIPASTFPNPVRAITLDRWNNIYVTGTVPSSPPKYSMYISRLNSSDFSGVWSTTLAPGDTHGTYPRDPLDFFSDTDDRLFGGNVIALDSKGWVWAAGRGVDGVWDGGLVVKLDPAGGSVTWFDHYGTNDQQGAVFALTIDGYDNVFVTGRQNVFDANSQTPPRIEILSPAAVPMTIDTFGQLAQFQENHQIAVDKKGNMYFSQFWDTGTTSGLNVLSAKVQGRALTAIATSAGTGKSKVLMDTFDHQNILLSTFSASDVLQMATTSWNYGTYGRHDVGLSAGPDGSVRILQQLDFNGSTSAAVSVLVRNDSGTLTSSSARNVTNLQALKIATGSDNKSYILLRSTVNGSCQVWRMSATGAFEASATFSAQTNKAPTGIAVDGTSIVYLIWQGLDGKVYPWRLNPATLAITNQTASLSPGLNNVLVGAGVGGDHLLRVATDYVRFDRGETLWSLNSSGTLVNSGIPPFSGWIGFGYSVGGDNRSHVLNGTGNFIFNYQHLVANGSLVQTSAQTFTIPAN